MSKTSYDGAGRVVKTFVTDGGGDVGWADVGTVTGDLVLSQTETQYDSSGNPILVITKDRFHDETGTGELSGPGTAPKARVSYTARYYDAADRLTDSVDVGTNGGLAYTRPATVPARSDTVLVSSSAYKGAGLVEAVTDPGVSVIHGAGRWDGPPAFCTSVSVGEIPQRLPLQARRSTSYIVSGTGSVPWRCGPLASSRPSCSRSSRPRWA